MSKANGETTKASVPAGNQKDLTCGLIMPISALDGLSLEHWAEVKSIVVEAVESIGPVPTFVPRLVSDADEIGVIQKRIIQNVYNDTIVVCDVSGKNPNVMFELGLRLAFDKPTVIIKDDKTDYSFDTGVIEHLHYPRDLRFTRIVEFKKQLAEKLLNTYKASVSDPTHSPFLKSFGEFHVASLTQTETSPDRVMMEMLAEMQRDMQLLKRRLPHQIESPPEYRVDSDWKNMLLQIAMDTLLREGPSLPLELVTSDRISHMVASKFKVLSGINSPAPRKDVDAALVQAASMIRQTN